MALRVRTIAARLDRAFVVMSALCAVVAAGCGGAGSGGNNPPPATTYTISGTVSGTTGVTVTLSGAASRTVTTAADGSYAFTGLANGAYVVTPTKASFAFSPASTPVVVNGADRTGIDFAATQTTYTISGTVTGAASVTVTLSAAGAADRTTTTAANGTYAFAGLPSGTYTVTPSKAAYSMLPLSTVVVVNGADRAGVDFAASASTGPTYTLSGTITKAWGGALAGVQVTVSASGTTVGSVGTDATGHFTLSGVSNGSYVVTPALAGYAFTPAAPTVAVSGADATRDFTADGAYTITGHVTTAWSDPLAAVSVAVNVGGTTKSARTDGSGAYTISGVPPGSFTVTPTLAGYVFTPAAPTVAVNGAGASQDFSADGSYTITGTVMTAWSAPLQGIVVSVPIGTSGTKTATTNASGVYTITGVPDGSYVLGAALTGYVFTPSSPTVVVSGGGATRDLTADGAYTITGVVNTAWFDPLQGVTVTVAGGGFARGAATNASGAFTVSGVPPGSFTVTPALAGYAFAPSAPTVMVTDVTPNPIQNFTADGAYTITGTVTTAWGALLPGVSVAFSAAGVTKSPVLTNASGVYTIDGVPNVSATVTPTLAGYVFTPAAPTVVVNGATATRNFAADGAYAITGTVTTAWGTLLQNVSVSLSGGSVTKAAVTTNASGVYTISGVPTGSYTVTPTLAGYAFTPSAPTVAVGTSTATRDFTADGAYTVSGAVTTVWGAPISGVSVALAGGGVTKNTSSGTDGSYSFAVPNGTFTVTPTLATYTFLPAAPSVVVSGASRSQSFTASGSRQITGTITTAWGAPLQDVSLTLAAGGFSRVAATTDGTGAYTIAGVPDGSYTVTPALAGYVFTPPAPTVVVSGASPTRDFTADGAYQISGVVTEAGLPLSGVSIAFSGGGLTKAPAVTGADGTYTFTGLPNGSYTLTPTLTGHTISPASPTVVVNGADATQSFTSINGIRYTISGTLTGAGAVPLAGMTVRLSGSATGSLTTNASGAYAFDGLTPGGTYTVAPQVLGYTFNVPSRTFASLAGNQTADFTSSQAAPVTYTGTVSYAGSRSGPVYLSFSNGGGTGLVAQAGPFSGRTFTVRNVPAGYNTVVAWMDTLGIGRYVSGADPHASANVYATGGAYAVGDLALVDPVGIPTVPAGNGIRVDEVLGFDQGAVVAFSPAYDTSGAEAADSYVVYWNTTTPVDQAHAIGSLVVPAGGTLALVKGLTNGTSYWFRVLARVGGTALPGQSALSPSAVVAGAPTGAATVSGTVSYPALPSPSALYVVAASTGDNHHFVQRIPNPTGTSTTYSLSVPPGAYQLFALVDLGDDGFVVPGEPTPENQRALGLVNLAPGANAGPTVAISPGKSVAAVTTQRWAWTGGGGAGLQLDTWSNLSASRALPLTVSVTGPGIPGGVVDLAPNQWSGGNQLHVSGFLSTDPLTPTVGDQYAFAVTYTDSSTDALAGTVTGVFGGTPTLVAPADGATNVSTTPTFQWNAPASPSTPYAYRLDVYPQGGGSSSYWTTVVPSATTQVAFNADGGAPMPQLPAYSGARVSLVAVDADGNAAEWDESFTTADPQLTMFDPLSAATLDGLRWQTPQYSRTIVGGQALLHVQADDMQSRFVNNLSYTNQASVYGTGGRVTTLQADVTIPASSVSRDGTAFLVGGLRLNYQPAANRGFPFPAGNLNFTSVGVELYDNGAGPRVRARAYHCDDPACINLSNTGITPSAPPTNWTQSGVNVWATAAYDQTYTFTLSMNEATNLFTWTVSGGTFGAGVSGTADLSAWVASSGLQLNSLSNGFVNAQLMARAHDEGLAGGSSGAITAEFDNVYVGTNGVAATLYDDFATMGSNAATGLSVAKWASDRAPNGSVAVSNGLHVRTAYTAPSNGTFANNTSANVLYPATFKAWQADLTIASNTSLSGQDYMQMGGAFLNDGSGGPHNATGDYLGNVIVRTTGASYWVGRCVNAACNTMTTVTSGTIPAGSVGFGVGTTHTAFQQWDPVSMTATVRIDDGPPAQLTIPLSYALPPFVPSRYIQSAVNIPAGHAGQTATLDGVVTNVQIVP